MEITYFIHILKIQNIQCNTAAITAKLCFRNLNSNYDRNTYLMSKAGGGLNPVAAKICFYLLSFR